MGADIDAPIIEPVAQPGAGPIHREGTDTRELGDEWEPDSSTAPRPMHEQDRIARATIEHAGDHRRVRQVQKPLGHRQTIVIEQALFGRMEGAEGRSISVDRRQASGRGHDQLLGEAGAIVTWNPVRFFTGPMSGP